MKVEIQTILFRWYVCVLNKKYQLGYFYACEIDFSCDVKWFSNRVQQKILIRISMTDDKTRAKAMKTAVQFQGVLGAEIKGDHRNQIEVTGVEVDMICLTNTLRKKVAFAELVSVNKVEPPKTPEEKKPEPCYQPWHYVYGVPSSYPHPCDPYGYNGKGYTEEPVYNHEPNCRIM
ncbi:hypothetical protein HID58_053471 [Brassica napus]|uniref:BnaC03g35380D protein n=2 Tax=Brassica napus TaxID=3708 RepID=A0A078F0L6_BRANA|nr:hypothetical protein HID58_053471 [Brassica napus]CAF1703679.1 unnamed protein product [Brassica napus]CDY07985.1 BnaC03g35380D [Brassica napus]